MDLHLLNEISQLNPWLGDPSIPVIQEQDYITRIQMTELKDPEWDSCWTILEGPRRAGKTTLGKLLAQELIHQKKYKQLLYLNCDYRSIRQWLSSPIFIKEALETFNLSNCILMIDEAQRLENPGLLLKAVIDLGLPMKYIATGSSQLEMKSKVQEFLTGRQFASLVLPLSYQEYDAKPHLNDILIYGSYPQILFSSKKELQLTEIFKNYIQKDIIEILKIGDPDVFQQLITLLAHHSGQLVNYNQLSVDCKASATRIRHYIDILEKTYVIVKITPFVGNKRTEITSNPIYYFVDNGFRNVALRNFSDLNTRSDMGFLIENFVFQEIYKYKFQHYLSFDIHYWRTKSKAEVDFVLYKNDQHFLPIEVKYRTLKKATIPKGLRSFITAYHPKQAIIITNALMDKIALDDCVVHFIPLQHLQKVFNLVSETIA